MKIWQKMKQRAVWLAVCTVLFAMWSDMTVSAAETGTIPVMETGSVSENSIPADAVSGNNISGNAVSENTVPGDLAEKVPAKEQKTLQKVDPYAFQTSNYKEEILTDWTQILQALRTLTPEKLTGAGEDPLVLQMQNVGNIPAEVKDVLQPSEESDYTKILQCNLGNGATIVINGAENNAGFSGISDTGSTVNSESRGKRSMAVTVRFASHENFGAVAGLQINLPRCDSGTKVSVYAETISTDAQGNVTVGENVCIGHTKADANGNVEVPIQSTANYMFVYKAAKE